MFRLYLQHFSGSIKGSNYKGQELVNRFWDKDEAHSRIDKLLKQAEKDGYIILDGAYFKKDHSETFSFCIIPEDDAPLKDSFSSVKGVFLNAR